jgi:two-component system, OmpR family, catabolic regulation response regulator CreB
MAFPRARVLFIEDDETVAAGTMAVLELDGHESACVSLGSKAVEANRQFQADVIVLDLGLPDVSGEEVYRDIRKEWPDLPVIFVSGSPGLEAPRDQGSTAFIQKPFSTIALVEAIERLLKR